VAPERIKPAFGVTVPLVMALCWISVSITVLVLALTAFAGGN
jgi:hypothetical protein